RLEPNVSLLRAEGTGPLAHQRFERRAVDAHDPERHVLRLVRGESGEVVTGGLVLRRGAADCGRDGRSGRRSGDACHFYRSNRTLNLMLRSIPMPYVPVCTEFQ